MNTYKIIRYYQDIGREDIVATGLTLEEAREHCNDPETSSETATGEVALARTKCFGPWFHGYSEE